MNCDEAIELIKSGDIYCRNRDMTGDLLSLLASLNDGRNNRLGQNELQESNEWYLDRNRKLAEIIIKYMKFCKKLRSSIVPTDDIFTDFKIDTGKIAEAWKQIPSMTEIEPDILQTLKDIVDEQK